jgi:hypothetical protein
MEKFLSIPVTGQQDQLVSATDIKLIKQASTTTVTITYGGGKVVTITHATNAGASDRTQRDAIQSAVIAALQTVWNRAAYQIASLPYAVSGVTIA